MVVYECECCNYNTKYKTHYTKHLLSMKHSMNMSMMEGNENNVRKTVNERKNVKNSGSITKVSQRYHRGITKYHKGITENVEEMEDDKNDEKIWRCELTGIVERELRNEACLPITDIDNSRKFQMDAMLQPRFHPHRRYTPRQS